VSEPELIPKKDRGMNLRSRDERDTEEEEKEKRRDNEKEGEEDPKRGYVHM
jgi:hypothetical protein